MKYYYSLIIILVSLFSCQSITEDEPVKAFVYTDALLAITEVEHAIYSENYDQANSILSELDILIMNCEDALCTKGEGDIESIISDVQYLENCDSQCDKDHRLDKLRVIKSKMMMLELDDEYDPYIFMLWQFEEDMYYASKAAMDPMLDLYEWDEFENMVLCMNENWNRVMYHYPSYETLGGDDGYYRNQVAKKIILNKQIEVFYRSVIDFQTEDDFVCVSAFKMREAYKTYLKALLMLEDPSNIYLA